MDWMFKENIARFEKRIAEESDARALETLQFLLKREQDRLAEWEARNAAADE